jgi:hypothetical protein
MLSHWHDRAHAAEKAKQFQEAAFARGVIFGLQMAYGQKLRLPGLPVAIGEFTQCERVETRPISA